MRVALVPLDSRPANWQFPQRLSDIAGIELALPPRELLGTLHTAADQRELLRWLRQHAREADAAVFAWDALLYGGLVQSRNPDLPVIDPQEVMDNLAAVDWRRTAGYAFITLPRLGITTASQRLLRHHEAVRELFIASGDTEHEPDADRLAFLTDLLGPEVVAALWAWRQRNFRHVEAAARVSSQLGLRRLHTAVEDNAPRGPHLDELKALAKLRLELLHEGGTTKLTAFDGADEAGCLLLARAIADHHQSPPLDVQLTVHPPSPGAHNYRGLFESHTLQEGLDFLEKFLGFRYTAGPGAVQWLVAHGVQPQPDAFNSEPERLFASPYFLPREAAGRGALFVSDLAVCNAANPHLAYQLAGIAPGSLGAIVGFNTNFNCLGLTAALLSVGWSRTGSPDFQRFALERLADDLCYQALARTEVLELLRANGADPLDFSGSGSSIRGQCLELVRQIWLGWIDGRGGEVLSAMGLSVDQARQVEFTFPWNRAFEIEATAPMSTNKTARD